MTQRIAALLLAALGAMAPALARADAHPAELHSALPRAELAGRAKLTVWGFEIYHATLWVAPGFDASDYTRHGFALELAYLRDLGRDAIASRSVSEMRRQQPLSDSQAQRWEHQLRALLPDVVRGDRITGLHQPGVGLQFLVNGQRAGELPDPELAKLFFGIWLSPMSSEPGLRQQLLAGRQP